MIQCIDRVIPLHKYNKIMQVPQRILRSKKCQKKGIGNGWEMGAASCPHIADEGWAGFRETIERERRQERERERECKGCHRVVTAQDEGKGRREYMFQPFTSVIRLYRAGKKIAGSVLVVAEDEKTRRLNKKTCVAHALWLIGCVP